MPTELELDWEKIRVLRNKHSLKVPGALISLPFVYQVNGKTNIYWFNYVSEEHGDAYAFHIRQVLRIDRGNKVSAMPMDDFVTIHKKEIKRSYPGVRMPEYLDTMQKLADNFSEQELFTLLRRAEIQPLHLLYIRVTSALLKDADE